MLPCFALFPTDLQGKEGLLAVYSQSESSNFFRSIISKLIRQNMQAMQLNAAYTLFRFQFIICQILTRRARWRLEWTKPKHSLPISVEIVGSIKAPQSNLVRDTGSDSGVGSAGVRVAKSPVKRGKKRLRNDILLTWRLHSLNTWSSQRTIFPSISANGIVGSPTNKNKGSAFSITSSPSLWPKTCITVTAP